MRSRSVVSAVSRSPCIFIQMLRDRALPRLQPTHPIPQFLRDESWSVGFGTNDPEKNHGRVVNLFASMLDQSWTNPNHSITRFFRPAQMSQNVDKPWLPNVFNDLGGNQSGYQQFEGRLEAREESGRWVPKELVYNNKQSGQLIKIAA